MNIPILLYHRIDRTDERTTLCVSPERFLEHMAYIAKNGYKVISLRDIISHKNGTLKLPYRSIAITFDDGYEDNYTNAFPILKKYGFPATIFLVPSLVGSTNQWDAACRWPKVPLMDWPQIIEMANHDIEFGSHSLTHTCLSKLKFPPYLFKEIGRSKEIIEHKTKKLVELFSYPYGRSNRFIKFLVKVYGYKGACATNKQPLNRKDNLDVYSLKRIEINTQNSSLPDFIELVELATRPRLNIMQVCTHSPWGGQELYSATLAAQLKEQGHKVVFVLRKDGFLKNKLKDTSLTIECLRIKASLDLMAIFRLIRLMKKHKINIIHGHVAKEFCPVVLAAKLAGRKVVLTRHLLTPLRKLTQLVINRANVIIAVSDAVKNTLVKDGIIEADKIKTIYNGVETKLFYPAEKDIDKIQATFGFDKDDFIIGNVGHMASKGQEELVLALKKICKKYPKTKCIFVSDYTADIEYLKALASEGGISDNIVFKEYQEDISKIMRMIDLFVIAPKAEAFGIVLIEAMACAKPVIATNVGGIKEIVKDRINGLLVPYQDVEALFNAIIYMIENRDEAARMGLNGYKIVREKFDLKNHLDKIEEVYYRMFLE